MKESERGTFLLYFFCYLINIIPVHRKRFSDSVLSYEMFLIKQKRTVTDKGNR